MYEFKFPDIGEGITQGEVVKWHVKVGDKVKADQVVVDVETDKAVVNLPAPVSGIVAKVYVKEGAVVKVGQVLVTITEKGEKVQEETHRSVGVVGELEEAPPELEAKEEEKFYFKDGHHARTLKDLIGIIRKVAEEDFRHHVHAEKNDFANWIRYSLGRPDLADQIQPVQDREEMLTVLTGKRKQRGGKILALPKVRKLAKERGIDLSALQGSGSEGRIVEADLGEQTSGIRVTKKYDLWGYVERLPLRGMRRTIAERMTKVWQTIPHVTHCDDADVTHLVEIREKQKATFAKQGVKLTLLPFIMKACIEGLKACPLLNATLDGEEIVIKKYYNIGFAVAVEDGLLVPVVKRAEEKTIPVLAKELTELSEKARKRTIDMMELKGGTFTITNIGSIGGKYFTPIINAPEVAILGIGRVYEQVVERDGEFETRKMLPLSLSFDHRVVDGAYAARFLNVVKNRLENPEE